MMIEIVFAAVNGNDGEYPRISYDTIEKPSAVSLKHPLKHHVFFLFHLYSLFRYLQPHAPYLHCPRTTFISFALRNLRSTIVPV